MIDYDRILDDLKQLPQSWHDSGPLDDNVLKALAGYCREYGTVNASVETGAGKSTLFFSRVSCHHTVFTIDIGQSLTKVKQSDLLTADRVEFVEGPTQRTMRTHTFGSALDVVLIDGPHGYPFPDLEYYHLYPHLAKGGLLVIDDISIPSIKRMADIIKSDDMFCCLEVVGKTMFLRRTQAPVFDPLADGWWRQNYNKGHWHRMQRMAKIKRKMPTRLFSLIPESLRLRVQKYF